MNDPQTNKKIEFWFEVYTDDKELGTQTIAQAENIADALIEQKEAKKILPDQTILIDMWTCIDGVPRPMTTVCLN